MEILFIKNWRHYNGGDKTTLEAIKEEYGYPSLQAALDTLHYTKSIAFPGRWQIEKPAEPKSAATKKPAKAAKKATKKTK